MGSDDPVPEHVKDGDDVLLDTGIQEAGQLRVAIQRGNLALDQVTDVRCQLCDPGFQGDCDRGDQLRAKFRGGGTISPLCDGANMSWATGRPMFKKYSHFQRLAERGRRP